MRLKTYLTALMATVVLAGCASSPSEVEMMADHRASVLESGLPYKHGPLHIMSAKAKGNTVEILMIYNNTGTIAPSQLIDNSIKAYCQDNEVSAVLNKGVMYRLILRSERGKILVDKTVNDQTCSDLDN